MSDDHGAPISLPLLRAGHARPGVGRDAHRHRRACALPIADADIFDGIVIDTRLGPGGHRFVDAPEVASIAERAVTLTLDAAPAARLPKPSANPGGAVGRTRRRARGRADPQAPPRAWDLLSGRY